MVNIVQPCSALKEAGKLQAMVACDELKSWRSALEHILIHADAIGRALPPMANLVLAVFCISISGMCTHIIQTGLIGQVLVKSRSDCLTNEAVTFYFQSIAFRFTLTDDNMYIANCRFALSLKSTIIFVVQFLLFKLVNQCCVCSVNNSV